MQSYLALKANSVCVLYLCRCNTNTAPVYQDAASGLRVLCLLQKRTCAHGVCSYCACDKISSARVGFLAPAERLQRTICFVRCLTARMAELCTRPAPGWTSGVSCAHVYVNSARRLCLWSDFGMHRLSCVVLVKQSGLESAPCIVRVGNSESNLDSACEHS